MFEVFIEFILTIVFFPFEPWFDKKVRRYNKFFRVLIKAVVFILFLGLIALLSYIFRGYWV